MKRLYLRNYVEKGAIEAGCDEAGRGCLAGPVVAASVILPLNFKHKLLNDSKQLLKSERNILANYIKNKALAYGIGFVHHQQIDELNILNASFLAMHKAIYQLKITPTLLVVDGNRFNAFPNIKHSCQIKGDGRFKHIAAASVLAKTARDAFMEKAHEEFPLYNWKQNKGYPTKNHRQAIVKHGTTPYHRLSFKLLA